jgi:hypothetical protein
VTKVDDNVHKNIGTTPAVIPGGDSRYSGQKRKEYRPKAQVAAMADHTSSKLPLVPVSGKVSGTSILAATKEGGNEVVADTHKKQRTTSSSSPTRSADPAAAAMQPCQTQ